MLCPHTFWVQPAIPVRAVQGSFQIFFFSLQALALQLRLLDLLLCLLPPSRVCALPSPQHCSHDLEAASRRAAALRISQAGQCCALSSTC